MKCRISIKGRKIWVDNKNAYSTRPASTKISLMRDGVEVDSVTLDSSSSGNYRFPCLLVAKNKTEDYNYQIDEIAPAGYRKIVRGYNVINVLENITIDGVKIWDDNHNAGNKRPDSITIRLYQNGTEIDSTTLPKPLDTEDSDDYTFGDKPFADALGVPYAYTVNEDDITDYTKTIKDFTITNKIKSTQP